MTAIPVPVRIGLVLLGGLLLQVSLVNRFTVGGVHGDLLVVLAVAGGFVAGPERGAAIGFAAGLGLDLLMTTPLGLTALVYTVVGYVAGLVSINLIRSSPAAVVALAGLAAPAATAAWVVVGALFGQSFLLEAPVVRIGVVGAVVAILTIPAAIPVLRWAAHDPHTRVGLRS